MVIYLDYSFKKGGGWNQENVWHVYKNVTVAVPKNILEIVSKWTKIHKEQKTIQAALGKYY